MHALRVGGLTPLTMIDYPGELAAVVFCQGCPWRCGYCHNSALLEATAEAPMDWGDVFAFLEHRRGLLDAVVFSGGEPTLQRGLPDAIEAVHQLGFKVGLHTAGCYPRRLQGLIPNLDWIGLDIKTLPEDYAALTGVAESGAAAWTSLQFVLASRIAHEVRVTVDPAQMPDDRLDSLIVRLARSGVKRLALQRYRDSNDNNARLARPLPPVAMHAESLFEHVVLR